MSTQKSQEDIDFEAKLSQAFYKTTNKNYGGVESKCTSSAYSVTKEEKGINGKFTDVLSHWHIAPHLLRNVQECQSEHYWRQRSLGQWQQGLDGTPGMIHRNYSILLSTLYITEDYHIHWLWCCINRESNCFWPRTCSKSCILWVITPNLSS